MKSPSKQKRQVEVSTQQLQNLNCEQPHEHRRRDRVSAVTLQESEARLRLTLKAAQIGVWDWNIETGQFSYSEETELLLGLTVGSFVRSQEDLFISVHPDDRDCLRRTLQHALEEGASYEVDYRTIWPDDSIHWLKNKGKVFWDETDKPVLMTGTLIDISGQKQIEKELRGEVTEHQQAESALRESKAMYMQILDAISDMVLCKGPQSRIVYANKAFREFYNMTMAQLRDIIDAPFNNPDHTQQYIIDDAYVFNTGQTLNIPVETATRYDGQERQFHTIKSAIFNTECQVVQTVAVCRDITERRLADEALQQSETRFRELAQREELLNRLANQIRASLDLDTILKTAVAEIHKLLQLDRCLFVWYRCDAQPPYSEVVKEVTNSNLPSLLGHRTPIAELSSLAQKVLNKQITRVDDTSTLTDSGEEQFFLSVGYTALLAVPLHTQSGRMGLVSCSHSGKTRLWSNSEVALLQAVADQLVLAINQAELYEQSRTAAEKAQAQAHQLEQTLQKLQQTQSQLVQTEKMSSLGQMVAGVAHEINNPVNFIYGNLTHVSGYTKDLLDLVSLYQKNYPSLPTIVAAEEAIDLNFLVEDLPKTLSSMKMGAERIAQIVLSLRNFSRLDGTEMKEVDIHDGLDSTLLILQNRLKANPEHPEIQLVKQYGNLPKVECYAGRMNQVFMNLLANAIDALEMGAMDWRLGEGEFLLPTPQLPIPTIRIRTEVTSGCVIIQIADNGPGITQQTCQRLFDPFFTTKPVGKGTGLGLSISYQIVVEQHGGQLRCVSTPGQGAAFVIELPIRQLR